MKLCNLLAIFIFSWSSMAQDLGVRALSFGGAVRAEASTNDVIFYNPAGIIKNRKIRPEFDYLYKSVSSGHSLGGSIVDSSTSSWGLGLAYNSVFHPSNDLSSSHLIYLATAFPLGTDVISLGTSASYLYNPNLGPEPYAHFFNMDAGLLVNLPFGLGFGLSLERFINAKGNEKPMALGFGSSFNFGALLPIVPLTIALDWVMEDVKSNTNLQHKLALGGEFIVLSLVPIRLGYTQVKAKELQQISLGSGLILGPLNIDLLYQQDLSVGENRNFGGALRVAI